MFCQSTGEICNRIDEFVCNRQKQLYKERRRKLFIHRNLKKNRDTYILHFCFHLHIRIHTSYQILYRPPHALITRRVLPPRPRIIRRQNSRIIRGPRNLRRGATDPAPHNPPRERRTCLRPLGRTWVGRCQRLADGWVEVDGGGAEGREVSACF